MIYPSKRARRESERFSRRLHKVAKMARSIQSVYQLDAMLVREVPDPAVRAETRKLLLQFIPGEAKCRV